MTVLLVMKKAGNVRVMQQALEPLGLRGVGVAGAEELRTALQQYAVPQLGLVDVSGFGPAAWDMCETLRNHDVPFIVLSTPQELSIGSRSLEFGAASVVQKPVNKSALLQLIGSLSGAQRGDV